LCSQLAYTYSANRRAGFPFVLVHTSLDGKTLAKLEGMTDAGYKRWERTEWLQEGYETLWQTETGTRENTVYLTADSKDELVELSEDETYIIGGICDHNRYKVSLAVFYRVILISKIRTSA
jgi:tRNA (guanine9-N1)-methyltransferase